jgi:F-type H+-transporting ATPase subunit b
MEFLGNLGIDIKLLIAQMINFGVLLWLLSKFLYKPVIKRIEKDEKELSSAIEEKKKIDDEKEALEMQKKKEITKSKKRAKEIIKEAEIIAGSIEKNAREESAAEKQAVIKQIRSRLNEIKNDE